MNAMEKQAWLEIWVSAAAVVLAGLMWSWLGSQASTMFALLGLVVLGGLFMRQRGNQTLVDERDRAIHDAAKRIGVGAAWMFLFLALIVMSFWANIARLNTVSTVALNWLIWLQFAVYFAAKGVVAVTIYRSQQRAA